MNTKQRWVPVSPLEIAKNLIRTAGSEEARTALENTYDADMIIRYKNITVIQKDIDQNVLCTSTYNKKLLNGLFFLQKYRYTADHRLNSDHKVKRFYVQS